MQADTHRTFVGKILETVKVSSKPCLPGKRRWGAFVAAVTLELAPAQCPELLPIEGDRLGDLTRGAIA